MVIHIQGGKGRKDRDVMLSPVLPDELRAHWRLLPRKSIWLFPGKFVDALKSAFEHGQLHISGGMSTRPRREP